MRILEWLVEAFFTIKLFLSPTFLGGLLGGYVYFTANSNLQIYLAWGIMASGIIAGIILAWKVKKKRVASEFISGTMGNSDHDQKMWTKE